MNRRELFSCMAGAAGFALTGCGHTKQISGSVVGASDQIGHLLRDGGIPAPTTEEKIPVAIVGGGIAGLSAGWRLLREGMKDFRIFELEAEAGGNSRYGENGVTAYPWGAHYVPMPTKESRWVRILFEELGVIEGHDANGEPVYNERYLCATPQERLFIHGRWQEGLVPTLAASRTELDEFSRFAEIIDGYRQRRAFRIPMEFSPRDPDLLALDRISIAAFLEERRLRSKPLHWYVNYACRDDFGCNSRDVSAWAGIHYFASRGQTSDATDDTVLTWPEGNGWIVLTVAFSLVGLGQTQATTGSITGVVRDAAGAVMPGVTVTAAGPSGVSTATSNERGTYVISNLLPGAYSVSASLPGFTTATTSGIQVSGGNAARAELTLQLPRSVPRPFPDNKIPDIRADRQTRQGAVVQYRGNVRMATNGVELRADELDYNEYAGTGDVRGNVTFRVVPGGVRVIPLAN